MKNKWYILAFLIICLSCDKDIIIQEEIEYFEKPNMPCFAANAPLYSPGEMAYGRVAGLKNCLPFMASVEMDYFEYEGYPGVNLIIKTFEDWEDIFVLKELILIGGLGYNEGIFSMYIPEANDYQAHYSTLKDFDIFEDIFEIDPSYASNEITFLELNRTEGYSRGYFNCRFLLASSNPSGRNPDTITFQDCYFEAWKP